MPARLASLLLLVLLAVPAVSQAPHPHWGGQREQRTSRTGRELPELTAAEPDDPGAARLQAIHRDAKELTALSASVQSDLQQLGKDLLAKDLGAKLKKMEKLSKKLRQELNP